MRWSSLVAGLVPLLSLAGCGPEPAVPGEGSEHGEGSEYAEVCGTLGPHRMLEFAPGEWLHSRFGGERIGDRLYFITGTGEAQYPELGPPDATVYSTGLCGEDRRHLADDIRWVFTRDNFPGVLLGCRGTIDGPLFVLDPAGMAAPRLLAPAGCRVDEWATHGFVQVEEYAEDIGRVLFYSYPTDLGAGSISPVVLAEAIQVRHHVLRADEVLALDPDDNLIRIALPDGQITVEQAGVRAFLASQDGRYLAWEDLATADDDPQGTLGDLVLRDRETGVETVLAAAPHHLRMARLSSERIELWHRDEFGGGNLIALPSFAATEVPPHRRLVFTLSDRRWLMEGDDEAWYLRDPVDGTEVLLTAEPGRVNRASVEFMYILRRAEDAEPRESSELWRYPLDGGEPEQLAQRVTTDWSWLPDERVYTLVDLDAESFGDLVVIDPETLEERRLDSRAKELAWFGWVTNIVEDDTIAYQVLDGDRSGVWIVRPASE
ncbi:hypothetical protein [Nannocystis radixulma]|uniref:Lipoprotein n=1 Tax=Nannocystis radixulma TaxID=2995305 RepID=A0ABT5AYW2_9BACT|nr:hypothetical protein [Nannocystis radixulma]MDC0667032.1 hypothetical protein [Nannocystis radixulma]